MLAAFQVGITDKMYEIDVLYNCSAFTWSCEIRKTLEHLDILDKLEDTASLTYGHSD